MTPSSPSRVDMEYSTIRAVGCQSNLEHFPFDQRARPCAVCEVFGVCCLGGSHPPAAATTTGELSFLSS
jgi:hypothetical protein